MQPAWIPYCGMAPGPGEWLSRWNFDPLLLAALVAVALTYRLRFSGVEAPRKRAFAAFMLLAVLLFVSPFCALTSALFSARVAHHVALAVIAAPLLVMSLPREAKRLPGSLVAWTAFQALIFWAWHSPPLYAEALSNDAVYWTMQFSLLASAVGFWLAVRRASPTSAVAALLATMVQMGLLGALITFAAAPLYAPHFSTTLPWGLAPLDDQQLAGLIMWAPAAAFYLAAALLILGRWLREQARPATAA
ncbi:MAG: cytochrome c oxidase assembly protein [Pseudomonadota bacterium]|nr:cytochrome c oxidase assembly protein [Pseudomonadota bacterium]